MPTAAVAFAKALPERFLDLGIAEQNAVSVAAGLARMGFIPIIPLFACFSARRALDQVTIQAAYAGLNVKVCGLYAGLTSPNTGATHQMVSDLATMRAIPHLTVVEPADALEMRQALEAVVLHAPRLFPSGAGRYRRPGPRVSPTATRSELGKAALLREGTGVTLIGSGLMVARCLRRPSLATELRRGQPPIKLDADLLVARAPPGRW
jgi:transketolase